MEVFAKIMGYVVLGVTAIAVIAALGLLWAFPIKWTWNATIPPIFALPTITWGKAWCLNFLCGCLIKASQTNNNK